MHTGPGFTPAARFLLVTAAFVVVVAGMRAAAPLLTPFLLAMFLSVIAAPPLFYLRRRGLPLWLALMVVVAVIAGFGGILGAVIGGSVDAFSANLPEYQENLRSQASALYRWIGSVGLNVPAHVREAVLDPGKLMKLAGQMLSGLGGVLTNAFLILLTVVFILLEAASLPHKLQVALKRPEISLARLQEVMDDINRYMVIKTSTSLLTGVGIWLWLLAVGVDFPVLWGTLAFLLNFVPNIGSIIAAVPAVLLAVVQLDLPSAVWVAVGYLVINFLIGTVLEPRFMGRGLGLSTLVVFISLVFWGWVLGPVGMFLSVPLTMTLKIALDSTPHTRAAAVLLGPDVNPIDGAGAGSGSPLRGPEEPGEAP